jgi:hypothetical protein
MELYKAEVKSAMAECENNIRALRSPPHERHEYPCAIMKRAVMENTPPFAIKVSHEELLKDAIHNDTLGMSEFPITV